MTTKTLRKLTTQVTIAFTAMIFLGFAIYKEIKVLYTYVSKSQILQRQGSPSSEINGITLLWFAIFAATLYFIIACIVYFAIRIQKIREVKSLGRQRKSEVKERKATRQKDESENEAEKSTLCYILVQELKEKYNKRVNMTEEQWEEIKEDTECLDYDELCDLISKCEVTW